MIEQLELEIEVLLKKAEDADSAPLDDGLILPDEIKRRKDRKAALERARSIIEERYADVKQEEHCGIGGRTMPRKTPVSDRRRL